jgi:hypothetical protein
MVGDRIAAIKYPGPDKVLRSGIKIVSVMEIDLQPGAIWRMTK